MRWPIRNQILLPLVAIQLGLWLAVSSIAAWWALHRVEQEVEARLEELTRTVSEGTFPLTRAVLQQMRGLSGAEFLLRDAEGRVLASTLEDTAQAAALSNQAVPQRFPPRTTDVLHVAGQEYLVRSATTRFHDAPANVLILYPDSLIELAYRDAMTGPLALGAITLLLTTLSVVAVAYQIGRRIQRIEQNVARVASGDFEPIPISDRHDELRSLSMSVNRMGEDLERMASQIRETERARLIKQLAGGIAHQLRNALTGARLAVQLHQRRCGRPADESLEVALRQLALTEEQVRGLVALIRDEQRPRLPGGIDAIAREVVTLIRPMCEHRQIRLSLEGATGDAEISDSDQFRAALLNLCTNAVEATGAGGVVEVELRREQDRAVIQVRDDGPGIRGDSPEELFEPFCTRKPDGMGLGLALVRQAAEDHGGEVRYSRESQRTIFEFVCRLRLPDEIPARSADAAAADDARPARLALSRTLP
ncbi:MAG: HAMP domain-containing histidine kinase [Planctomyces sp.]|nr:HAMP domain-containing histidine kinase [Planctomyces sp.]